MEFIFIDRENAYYQQAVDLRISLFFQNFNNATTLINDRHEEQGLHLICLIDHQVVGTARLNYEENRAIISQMAVAKKFQQKGVGSGIMNTLLKKCHHEKINEIYLAARKTAIDFYRNFGFESFGEYYESAKTGVLHRNMKKFFSNA